MRHILRQSQIYAAQEYLSCDSCMVKNPRRKSREFGPSWGFFVGQSAYVLHNVFQFSILLNATFLILHYAVRGSKQKRMCR